MSNLHFSSPAYHPADEDELLGGSGGKDSLQVSTGFTKMAQYGVGAQGSGAWAKGHIGGTMTGYDYEAIYKVYTVPSSESSGWWVFKYQKDTSKSELKLVNSSTRQVNLKYDLDFMLQGNDFGTTSVYIYYSTIAVKDDTTTKQYVVTNDKSASASDPQGSPYSGFKPVPGQS